MSSVILYEHPLSPYAQKCKIALYEKGVAFELKMPTAIGTGHADSDFLKANPRAEVPALVEGDFAIFDSTVILEYIEDRWPTPPLLPRDAKLRAKARMIEEAMDTHYEPINWGLGEIRWFKRAEGEQARVIEARAAGQARAFYAWLERHLGESAWFCGETFGWADLSVIPYINGSTGLGVGPSATSKLGRWQARANARESVAKTAKAAEDSIAGMAMVGEAVRQRLFKREYRDHRLEWMIRSGGLDVVLDGIKADTIRFSNEFH
ncbi:MAG: glutathione S-transferase family protein [Alphaproteobacteria bacterium]|nr:glutathione S-transferase family protein [Alphaproteobacteria bacterium]